MKRLIAALPATLLATLVASAAPAHAAPPVNAYQQRLLQLPAGERAAALRGGITGNGLRCGRIDPPIYRAPYKNSFMWAARCTPGGDYAIYVGPDGSAQVRPCADQRKLGLPACGLPRRSPRRRAAAPDAPLT